MSKYMFKNFTAVLDKLKDIRYYYEFCDDGHHIIGCSFTEEDTSMIIETILENMRNNKILSLLEDHDYIWHGSMILFENKNHAALFYMFL